MACIVPLHHNELNVGGLAQDCSNSSALAMELPVLHKVTDKVYLIPESKQCH